jgi:hypothetical protein
VAQRKHLALSRRQGLERTPDALPGLAAERGLLRRQGVAGMQLVDEDLARPPPAPPARATSIAAGVDRHRFQPRPPLDRRTVAGERAVELEKHFLAHLLGLVRIAQQQVA